MKKLFLLFLGIVYLFSFEVLKKETLEVDIKGNKIEAMLNVSIFNKNLSFVMNNISNLKNSFCKIDNYTISPFYVYEKKNPKFKGYKAKAYIKCTFSENEIDKFTKYVEDISQFAKVSINHIGFLENKNEIERIFKIQAYEKASAFAKKLSKKLNQKCFVKNINFYHINLYPVKRSIKALSLPVPDNKKHKFSFSYTIECL